jgi:hypothetical protein
MIAVKIAAKLVARARKLFIPFASLFFAEQYIRFSVPDDYNYLQNRVTARRRRKNGAGQIACYSFGWSW